MEWTWLSCRVVAFERGSLELEATPPSDTITRLALLSESTRIRSFRSYDVPSMSASRLETQIGFTRGNNAADWS